MNIRSNNYLTKLSHYNKCFFFYRLALDSVLTNLADMCYRRCYTLCAAADYRMKSQCRGTSRWCPSLERWRAWTESVIWMVLSIVLALFVPQVKYVISPMGCLAAVFMLVFPGEYGVLAPAGCTISPLPSNLLLYLMPIR